MSSPRSRTLWIVTLAVAIWAVPTLSASADVIYDPSPDNGQKLYLSQACHDGQDGVPGGPCISKYGCSGHMGENEWSDGATLAAIYAGTNVGLVEREYIVRIGTGTVSQNITASNGWGALMHIPVHSNADPTDCVAPYSDTTFGTEGLYYSTNGSQLAQQFLTMIGPASPGGGTEAGNLIYRSDLGELTGTNAKAAYLEAEYHTYGAGWPWLHDYATWIWRLGAAVDRCRGYPRDFNADQPTSTKYCTW